VISIVWLASRYPDRLCDNPTRIITEGVTIE
jgi:hypothetical protein